MFNAFKQYFERPDLQDLKVRVSDMSSEEFDCLYESLTPQEQAAFTLVEPLSPEDELSRYLIYVKTLFRFSDARNGKTVMDDEGILHVTPESTVLELPITLNTFMEFTSAGFYSIGDTINFVSESATGDAADDILTALQLFRADTTIVMEDHLNVV